MNLNDDVWVQLNERGLQVYLDRWKGLGLKGLPAGLKVRGGWTRFQLWDLAFTFGQTLYMGGPLPFRSTAIRREEP